MWTVKNIIKWKILLILTFWIDLEDIRQVFKIKADWTWTSHLNDTIMLCWNIFFFQWENVTMVTFWSLKKINVLLCFSFNACILWRFDQHNLALGWLGDLRSNLRGQNCSTWNPNQWERFLIHNWALAKSFWGLKSFNSLLSELDLISNLRGHPRPKRRLETFLLTCDFCVFFFTSFEVSNHQDYQTESIFTQVNFFYTKSVLSETFLVNCIVLQNFSFSILSFVWPRKSKIQFFLALNCTKLHAICSSALSAKQHDFIDGAVK